MRIRSEYEKEDKEKDEGGVSMRVRSKYENQDDNEGWVWEWGMSMRMRGEYENRESMKNEDKEKGEG